MKTMNQFAAFVAVALAMASAVGQQDCSHAKVGDVVLSNGSVVSPADFRNDQRAVAVIVREDDGYIPALGVGIKKSEKMIPWCKYRVGGFEKNIRGLVGGVGSGYMDGHDGWEILKSVCADAGKGNDATLYPAWNFCNTYGMVQGLKEYAPENRPPRHRPHSEMEHGPRDNLAEGWYLPTLAELKIMFDNREAIDAALEKVGGDKLGTYWYWSCCQSSSHDDHARLVNFSGGSTEPYRKSNYNYVRAVRIFY